MEKEAFTRSEAIAMPGSDSATVPAPDLDLRVIQRKLNGDIVLEYSLSSPSGVLSFDYKTIRSEPLRDVDAFKTSFYQRLASLHQTYAEQNRQRLAHQLKADVSALGRWLYDRLFPTDLRTAYQDFRSHVRTLRIVSDEDWIPWELIKPHEGGREDGFLGLQFQLTRWLAGKVRPAEWIPVSKLGCVIAGDPSLSAGKAEKEHLRQLAAAAEGVRFESPSPATWSALETLLENGELNLLHFSGHGSFAAENPAASSIRLSDRAFTADHLSGALAEQIRAGGPLVFLNACHVGRQGWALTGLDGWAPAWIHNCCCGAFLGPQWAVDDDSSRRFAESFYTELAAGATFGAAAQTARHELVTEEDPDLLNALSYAVYAHPNGRLVLGKAVPEAAPAWLGLPASTPAEIRRQAHDYRRLILDKTAGFVGRGWVFEQIDRFLAEKPRGYFVLRGDPGIGKSALAAELVRRSSHLHHFNVRSEGITSPGQFLGNVCAQLIARYRLAYNFLPPEATQDGRFLKSLLERVASSRPPGEKVVLVVDALDEVDSASYHAGANPLYLPSSVPESVYFVVTSRRGCPNLSISCELRPLDLEQDDKGNLADVQELIESWLGRPGIADYCRSHSLTDADFVKVMVEKSQGNFMYLRYVLPEIATNQYHDDAALPDGLENYYETHWSRMRSRDETRWFDYQIPTLVALTVVKEPVSLDLLTEFSGTGDRRRVLDVLKEWDPFIYSTEVEDEDGQRQRRYRLYHASFQEFIAGKDEVAGERVSLREAHGKIADILWKGLYGEDGDAATDQVP